MSLVSADLQSTIHDTKRRLLEASVEMMLERGYTGLSVDDVLRRTGISKGSFYHHFQNKQDMALQAIDLYTGVGHQLIAECLKPDGRPALERLRTFFEQLSGFYRAQGYFGCLLGALGQELSGANEIFRHKIESCLSSIADAITESLKEAQREGALPAGSDTRRLANVLLNAWEGAALRSRLLRSPEPLKNVLDFCLTALATA